VSDDEVDERDRLEIVKMLGDDGVKPEKIKAVKESRFIRKLVDPKLPSQAEIDEHNQMGHVV